MNRILLALVVFSLLVGCASLEDPPPELAKLGDYCLGQLARDRNLKCLPNSIDIFNSVVVLRQQ